MLWPQKLLCQKLLPVAKEKIRRRIWYNRQREEILQSPEEITLYSGPSNYWWITGKLHPFLAHIGCDTGDAVQGTTFLYHIVPRKRVREEENLGPSRGRELTVFHKCAGPIPILGNKWRKRSDTNGKKASRKGQRQ